MVWAVSDCAVKSLGEVAVLSAVAMSKVTPPAPAGDERLTVKSNEVVPELPSPAETSLIERLTPVGQTLKVEAVVRGIGVPAAKSEPLLSVSVHPPAAR